ncbi:hypothetical protein [Pannonibacter phragmitetus]|uniref:hypothetical protein n=1 Tax=Pannonibacter phragmitetus TaxID=121719 RepID=UPI003D2F4F92
MSNENNEKLETYIENGWKISGYSTVMMAAGAMVHSILLQNDSNVIALNIVKTGAKEVGRTVDILSPVPEQATKKTGWF